MKNCIIFTERREREMNEFVLISHVVSFEKFMSIKSEPKKNKLKRKSISLKINIFFTDMPES